VHCFFKKAGYSARTGFVALTFASAALVSDATNSPHYLSERNLAVQLLPAPPLPGSSEQTYDLAEVTLAHRALPSVDETLVRSEKRVYLTSFADAIGGVFQTNRFPKAEAFLRRVLEDTDIEVNAGKELWKRPRPYLVDTNLLMEGESEKLSGSYPSGHSTRATVLALILAEMFPERREAILSRGREIGWHRVVLAKHYPTDIYAGRVLAQAIVFQLKLNRNFRHDFKAAQAEIRTWMREHPWNSQRALAQRAP
jgi:acid phosphatase (class A)